MSAAYEREYQDAILDAALASFRENGPTASHAQWLTDEIYSALSFVEKEVAFDSNFVPVVERAFNRLRINGYRCEHNWQCCMTCGWAMIDYPDADHAVWYHSQDRDSAIITGGLRLVWTGDAALIREAFEAEGLIVEHGGTAEERILVRLEVNA